MNRYLIKRLLLLFPAILIVLLLTMLLGHLAGEIPPYLYQDNSKGGASDRFIDEYSEKHGLKEAFFYFSVKPAEISGIFYPQIQWNDKRNRFHRYISSLFNGSLGYSSYYKSDVWSVIKLPLLRTLILNFIASLIIYSAGLYFGYFQVLQPGKLLSRILEVAGHVFYAFPPFWLAILLLWFFSNQQIFYIFPSKGWYWDANEPFLLSILKWLWHIFLPVFCLSVGTIIYVSSIFREKLQKESSKTYYKALLARGFSHQKIIKKYLIKIALLPIVAISTGIIPAMISGSVIIESIFGIPGMGNLALMAFLTRDLQLIYSITVIGTLLTWLNWILADYIYSKLDPRIQWN